ncbi:hypothetical protein BOX15_Mlig007525g3 [Macrostomum lignano]|uniref:Uncharacterized protein n=2 Tax=Macrostomum lignano TaxID=282301 RepID=A0A267FLG4_9PLAT|nr:hypothetical protein BOX15_Mlig007525g3 [Macrostomum lignano]
MTTTLCLILALVASLAAALPQPQEVKEPKTASNEAMLIPMEVCYDGLGCFSTGGNFYDLVRRPLQLLPQSPERIGPTYALYTRRSIISGQSLVYGDKSSVEKSNFDASRPTKIIIHGFLENGSEDWVNDMKKALLLHGDYNVIQLDWSRGNQLPYTQATANTRVIGAMIAQMIVWLEAEFGASRTSFHLLGHSLGAHVSGYAGERLPGLARITGMDPAGPYFEGTHPEVRLDPTDANFVDAIHTDGDSLLSSAKLEGGFGMMEPAGHVDFYPNGGKKQPDCKQNPIISIIINGIVEGSKWAVACDHLRVLPLMTSTVMHYQGDYKAYPCDSYENFKAGRCATCGSTGCAFMGMRADEWRPPTGTSGVRMFLDTTGSEPFDIHHYAVSVSISDVSDAKKQYGDLYLILESETGERSSELTVFSKEYMYPGDRRTALMTSPDSVFNLARITVSWKHRWVLAILTQRLRINRIEIFEGLTEKRSLFCARDVSIDSGKSITLGRSNAC